MAVAVPQFSRFAMQPGLHANPAIHRDDEELHLKCLRALLLVVLVLVVSSLPHLLRFPFFDRPWLFRLGISGFGSSLRLFLGAGLLIGGVSELVNHPGDPFAIPALLSGGALAILGFFLVQRTRQPSE